MKKYLTGGTGRFAQYLKNKIQTFAFFQQKDT